MSSGNPHGLSEISHFGSFQRVGGKAGGFINKKFFHPSSLRNQEKLWKAQTADERESRKQAELQKRRDEERSVEEMRKQLYLAGQGKASDLFVKPAEDRGNKDDERGAGGQKSEQQQAVDEEKRRKALLRSKQSAETSTKEKEEADPSDSNRALAKSVYPEDVLYHGHKSVWGSWYSMEESKWGFGCCKVLRRAETCPLAPQEPPKRDAASSKDQPASKRRRRRGGGGSGAGAVGGPAEGEGDAAAEEDAEADEVAGLQEPKGDGAGLREPLKAKKPVVGPKEQAPLIDVRMFEAAARRREQKRLEEERKAAAKTSGYLGGLLSNPSGDPGGGPSADERPAP